MLLEILLSEIILENEIKDIQIDEKEIKLSLLADGIMSMFKIFQKLQKKLLKLVISVVSRCNINI